MKIVVIAPSSVNHTVKVVNELAKRNHIIHLFSLKNHREGNDKLNKSIKIYYSPNSSPIGYYSDVFWIRKKIKQLKPDVINVHYASGYGTMARLCGEHPALLSVWGSDIFDFPKKNFVNKRILQKNLKFFDHVVSTSNIMALETKKYLDKNSKVTVIPFGVDLNKFKPIEKNKNNTNIIKILCIKNLEPVYGIEFLIEAIRILPVYLQDDNLHVYLDIYGSGSQQESLQGFIERSNLSACVKLKGYVENKKVPRLLSEADICCIPSLRESFGVSVIEAMAMNIPVVATKTDGFNEIIDNNIDGFLVEIANSESLAEKIAFLIKNIKLRNNFASNAREKVEKLYDWKENMDSFETLLGEFKKS